MKISDKLQNFAFIALIFFIVCYPLQLQSVKFSLIILNLLFSLHSLREMRLSKLVFSISLLIVTYNMFNLVYHSLYGFSPTPYFVLFVISPAVYIVIFAIQGKFIISRKFFTILALFSAYISIIDINAILLERLGFGVPFLDSLFTGRVGIHEGYTQIVDYNVYSLFFLGPMLFNLVIYRSISMILSMPALVLTVLTIILTGRRALWLAIIVSVSVSLIIYIFRSIKSGNKERIVLMIIAGLFTISVAGTLTTVFNNNAPLVELASGLGQRLGDAFTESGGLGVRRHQQDILIREWLNSPLLGNGIAVPASVTRSQEFATAYEASYHALLYQLGIVGVLLYGIATAYILFQIISPRIQGEAYAFGTACGAGLISILIGVYSNPYFGSFDGLWMLFLPVMMYNSFRLFTFPEM